VLTNRHLPGIPTQEEVTKNGLNLGNICTALVEKVEEITLYLIELRHENEQLRQEIEELKKTGQK